METTPEARVFQLVLTEELRRPEFLTPDEVVGGWQGLFPNLATSLPTPYPIYGHDEEQVVTHGYPVLRSDGIRQLERTLDCLVSTEVEYRLDVQWEGAADKGAVMAERDRFHRSLSLILENVFMNDYGRGMADVFLLFLSTEVVRAVSQVPKLVRMADRLAGDDVGNRHRRTIAEVLGGLIQRAAHGASDRLRSLAQVRLAPKVSPLLNVICADQLLLTESRPSMEMSALDGYLRSRFHCDIETLNATLDNSIARLSQLMVRRSELGELLTLAAGTSIDLTTPRTLLEPRLLKALARADLLAAIGMSRAQASMCRDLGLSLKRFELLAALRRRIVTMTRRGNQFVLTEPTARGAVAPTTRPFDFTAPGVVDNSVRRFGLVYDLTNFTALLEDVRKKGRMAEEKALQFMYVFQNRLEEIRRDHRLIFEKFLGDGAFYSSRRALRILAAACEIQLAYDRLRRSGFPFDQGIRMALNHGVYRLLPMLNSDREIRRFEFFGHGIVELARLTTGKSTREIAEIAELLIHSGYDEAAVERFLAPVAAARSATPAAPGTRAYTAVIDNQGELVNEGIVLTFPFLEHLEAELEVLSFTEVVEHGVRWLLFPLDPERPGPYQVGLRYLGVARLKGLAPMELVEAAVWTDIPAEARILSEESSLIDLLRRMGQAGSDPDAGDPGDGSTIDEDLVVLSYLDADGTRQWVFGRHRASDDVLLQAIQMPMQVPTQAEEEPVETWLFRNRYELERLYQGVRRSDPGTTVQVAPLRRRSGYVGCFLAAPYKAP
jgi:hypothetical protein